MWMIKPRDKDPSTSNRTSDPWNIYVTNDLLTDREILYHSDVARASHGVSDHRQFDG